MANGIITLGSTRAVLEGRIVWESASNGSASNSSYVAGHLQVRRNDGYTTTGTWTGSLRIYNTTNPFSIHASIGSSWITVLEFSVSAVPHNDNGTGSCYIYGKCNGPSGTSMSGYYVEGNQTVTLDTIPRYGTSIQSLNSKTETTIKMNWSSNSTVDYIWYSTNNGGSWTAVGSVNSTNGTYTISGLSPNTSYNIKTRIRRKDSQLTTDSSNLSVTTYNYPYCISAPNFAIGDNVKIDFYNPLNRTIQIQMWSHKSTGFVSDLITTSGTSYTGFSNVSNRLYDSIPNDKSSVYNIDVHYGSNKAVKQGGTYSIKGSESPTFNNFTYEDANETIKALTGNNQILVSGYSNVKVTISTDNKATAKNSASMSKYRLAVGNLTKDANYSLNSNVTMQVDKVTNATISVSAFDSRTLSTTISKIAQMKNYTKPVITKMEAVRDNNGVGETVTLNFEGNWWNGNFGKVANQILQIKYYFRKSTDNNWTTGTTTITFNVIENKFSGNLVIYGDTTDKGFDASSSYYIKMTVQDKLDISTEYQISLGSGTPAIAIYKNNVAIGQKYDTALGGKLQVDGKVWLDYEVVDSW